VPNAVGALDWEISSGRGRLILDGTHQPLMRDFVEPVPYAVVVVEMEEGVRMVSGHPRDPELSTLALELPLEVVFETVAEGVRFPFFGPRRS